MRPKGRLAEDGVVKAMSTIVAEKWRLHFHPQGDLLKRARAGGEVNLAAAAMGTAMRV